MASAAAVGADAARSPPVNDIGQDRGLPGEITSGVYSKDQGMPGVNGDVEDSDEDLPAHPLRGHKPVRRARDDDAEDLENNLFGDDEDEPAEEQGKPARSLGDEELDSGDDLERTDRLNDEPEEQEEYMAQERVTMDIELPRQPIPEPSDGEMYLLKMPSFMSINPRSWDLTAFQPPTTDHHSFMTPSATFSAYNTALTTMRWRHSPSDHSKLQSNARINRWSDGSLTLQLASDPTTQYEMDGNPLAPPQRNPIKPTPVSKRTNSNKGGRAGASAAGMDEKYSQAKDAFTYLVLPNEATGTMLVTHKITAGLSIKQSESVEDDAIERLQASLAAASGASKVNGTSGLLVDIDEKDPEEAKRSALAAQKRIDAERRKQQAAADREHARAGRMGRGPVSHGRYSGLNVGMLEDDEEGGGRNGPSPHKARGNQPRRRRRNSEYSDDEDFGRRNFNQNEDYDMEDDFLAASDEEEVVDDDDDDPDDGIVEEPRHQRDRERTPKRDRAAAEEDDEEDAPGEEDEDVQMARTKRRRIVDDEDEDEE